MMGNPGRGRRARLRRRPAPGFTLIELLAVVLIFGLLASIALPNLGLRGGRVLDDESRALAATIEFARMRAVMTGIPHRLVFDLEGGIYRLEWYATDGEAFGDPSLDEPEAPSGAFGGGSPVDMSPPTRGERVFRPVTGTFGDPVRLDDLVFLDRFETPEGVYEQGELQLVFDRDGTSQPALIVLGIDDGRVVGLEVAPLADTVRFEHADS
jgi:prepilin-type N-terminal cleavage/methylation domain-containing protein